ncbi:hypothetical protein [Candidatus Lokiarchaeum ossiferum]|uniref:hypothetical protein n=1 Tax=Candidatus Lokiarchaeum ossiferum TaxID=2951803 RepID=UPI00352C3B3C
MNVKKTKPNHQKNDPDHPKKDRDLSHLPRWKQKIAKAPKNKSNHQPDRVNSNE